MDRSTTRERRESNTTRRDANSEFHARTRSRFTDHRDASPSPSVFAARSAARPRARASHAESFLSSPRAPLASRARAVGAVAVAVVAPAPALAANLSPLPRVVVDASMKTPRPAVAASISPPRARCAARIASNRSRIDASASLVAASTVVVVPPSSSSSSVVVAAAAAAAAAAARSNRATSAALATARHVGHVAALPSFPPPRAHFTKHAP